MDGCDLGVELVTIGMAVDSSCAVSVLKEHSTKFYKSFAKVTNGQLREGVDTFYADFKNRNIEAKDAAYLVALSIGGLDDEKWNKLVQEYRARS